MLIWNYKTIHTFFDKIFSCHTMHLTSVKWNRKDNMGLYVKEIWGIKPATFELSVYCITTRPLIHSWELIYNNLSCITSLLPNGLGYPPWLWEVESTNPARGLFWCGQFVSRVVVKQLEYSCLVPGIKGLSWGCTNIIEHGVLYVRNGWPFNWPFQ